MSSSIRDASATLAWSLWTELGVPGVVRNHDRVLVDPEPLIAWTPLLSDDPRLAEEVDRWCLAAKDRLSASRLRQLRADLPAPETSLLQVADASRHPPPPGDRRARTGAPKLDRPSLIALRLRALCGVGARAAVLTYLLSRPDHWCSAAQLAHETAFTKRNVSKVVSELERAGVLRCRQDGNRHVFRLADPPAFATLVACEGLALPHWAAVFRILHGLLVLEGHAGTDPVRRVAANTLRAALHAACPGAGLPDPPPTAGVADAFDVLMAWGREQATALADGRSPIFRRHGRV